MSKRTITLLVLPDLHGRLPKLFLRERPYFDAIITPGDICSDDLEGEGGDNIFDPQNQSLIHAKKILEELSNFNKPIYIVPGNWDPTKFRDGIQRNQGDVFKKILSSFPLVIDCEYTSFKFENLPIIIIGAGSTSAPEILSKIELNQILQHETDQDEIEELYQRYLYQKHKFEVVEELFEHEKKKDIESKNFKIFLSHNSPFNTPLDMINNFNSPLNHQHYGSILARAVIENNQPDLVISGHIHEGVGVCRIKDSLCLNAGFGEDIYHLVKIDTKNKKVLSIKRYGDNGV